MKILSQSSIAWLLIGGIAAVALPSLGWAQSDLEQRRERLELLSPSEKRDLIAKKSRFDQLSESEQERLRKLDEKVRNHPRSEELQQVLQSYGQWLKTLSANELLELRVVTGQERLDRIRHLRQRKQHLRLSKYDLTSRDADTVYQWWDRLAKQNETMLLESLGEKEKKSYERMNKNDPRRWFMLRASIWRSLGNLLTRIPRDDTNRLIEQLSPEARERFLKLETTKDQNDLLEKWIRESIRYRMRPPTVSDDELLSMIHRLPAAERGRLDKLPREEVLRFLRRRWESRQMWSMGSARGYRRGFSGERGHGGRFRGEQRPGPHGPPPKRDGDRPGRRHRGPAPPEFGPPRHLRSPDDRPPPDGP